MAKIKNTNNQNKEQTMENNNNQNKEQTMETQKIEKLRKQMFNAPNKDEIDEIVETQNISKQLGNTITR